MIKPKIKHNKKIIYKDINEDFKTLKLQNIYYHKNSLLKTILYYFILY